MVLNPWPWSRNASWGASGHPWDGLGYRFADARSCGAVEQGRANGTHSVIPHTALRHQLLTVMVLNPWPRSRNASWGASGYPWDGFGYRFGDARSCGAVEQGRAIDRFVRCDSTRSTETSHIDRNGAEPMAVVSKCILGGLGTSMGRPWIQVCGCS